MILIKLSEDNFEYDIQSMVRAFYHGEDVKVCTLTSGIEGKPSIVLTIDYQADQIVIAMYEKVKDPSYKIKGRVLTVQEDVKVDYSNRTETKNRLKKLLYAILSRRLKKELPWGTLTGIRPVKLPMKMLEEGHSEDEIREYMKDTYLISDEKLDLILKIARKEIELIEPLDYKNGYSVYIGIPFCPSTCAYCSFTSYPIARYSDMVLSYLDALGKEMEYVAEKFKYRRLNTIYVGGGTPTTLSAQQLEILMKKITDTFDMKQISEFSVEAGRPDSITREKLMVLKKYGVSRISINPQTMQNKTLKLIGRRHTVEEFESAFQLARECGFDNINTDIILGLPEEHREDVRDTVQKILRLGPENITVHSLAIKRAARLNVMKEQYENCYFEQDASIMDEVVETCKKEGYDPYYLYRQKNMTNNLENIGLAKKNRECYYNVLIMEEKQTIVGLGAGSVSKFLFLEEGQVHKTDNVKDVKLYLERFDEMIQRKEMVIQEYFSNQKDITQLFNQLPDAFAHGMCVSNLAYEIAKEYGMSIKECYELSVAGMLHDIGKIVLTRYLHDKLSMNIEQIRYSRMHSKLSYDILKSLGYSEFVLQSVLHHHENCDGSGFPDHLRDEEIPPGARILRVCDEFTALISNRPYRAAFDPKSAVNLMIEDAKNYDMKVFIAFQRVIQRIDFEKITIGREDLEEYGIK